MNEEKNAKSITKKEALLIAEEILKIIAKPNNHFAENIRENICDKLDIPEKTLEDVLDIISDIKDYEEQCYEEQ